ncbi:hypothetical protein PV332_02715 [Streptomyces scabiei]|uniref:hypothetical protein n=1 Tax=Streptomyces scabiei TaxID=1930 RepID=UPI0005A01057|nr:hypothetical protein [Streptomyces scabiei]MDX2574413.1 hypothetical protein [Streptomyces scabiei]MDX2721901.1 hypothetical protein [Streptomyces scabiei]MDX2884163.1 hypothetical protein [Streptomyces scabiei]MDX2896542.1 hypothetical protein [Streptomyces scabiei]MDX2905770.1 hypothetical protein [Streptomyces scabiei]
MGFSGYLIFARSPRPLPEAPVFDSLDEELRATMRSWESRPGGWQTLQTDSDIWSAANLPALVEWSGAPACVAEISDSSLALVSGMDTTGRSWQAWLNPGIAAGLLAEEPEDLEDQLLWLDTPEFHEAVRNKRAELDAEIPADAERAVAWAAAAGVQVTPRSAVIEELLRSHAPHVEDLFSTLLDQLGFPPGRDQ